MKPVCNGDALGTVSPSAAVVVSFAGFAYAYRSFFPPYYGAILVAIQALTRLVMPCTLWP